MTRDFRYLFAEIRACSNRLHEKMEVLNVQLVGLEQEIRDAGVSSDYWYSPTGAPLDPLFEFGWALGTDGKYSFWARDDAADQNWVWLPRASRVRRIIAATWMPEFLVALAAHLRNLDERMEGALLQVSR